MKQLKLSQMKTPAICLLAAALITLFTACASRPSSQSQAATTPAIIGIQDAGKIVHAHVGQPVVVQLEGNATTGYNWEYIPADTNVVRLAHKDYALDVVEAGVAGAGGRYIFRFVPQEAGRAELRFEYLRSWEKDVPASHFKVTLEISD
jgi:predicted secreted protein